MSTPAPLTTGTRARVAGVDAARGLALVGMMSVHLLPPTDDVGATSLSHLLAGGRASALFAVLAGVGLALVTGGTTARTGRRTASGVLARAAVVALLGLVLGSLEPPVAVILVHYALLFCCAIPFLGLGSRALAVWAAGWGLVSPFVAHALRTLVEPGPGPQPSLELLGRPLVLGRELLLTGYYPVLVWVTYLLVGLAVGRSDLASRATAAWLLGLGLVLAAGARLVAVLLLVPGGGFTRLAEAGPGDLARPGLGVDALLDSTGFYGTVPTTSWWWQAVPAAHTGTTLDLAGTVGSALVVVGGLCFLLHLTTPVGRVASRVLTPLRAAGSMTLTLYTCHVVAVAIDPEPRHPGRVLLAHVVLALTAATLWRATGRRGPLEQVAHDAAAAARGSR